MTDKLQEKINKNERKLIEDLDDRGLLEDTLVVVVTEFGRTPKVNRDAGRDHWPRVFSVLAAGGGVKRGYVHGASNATGSEPDRDPVSAPDFAATVFHQMGIDPSHELMSPGDRPIEIEVDGGVDPTNAGALAKAGATALVAGSAVYKGNDATTYAPRIKAIRDAALAG